jgi:spore germination protein YaaH
LTVTWLCNTRTAQPLEYADIVSVLAAAGVRPTWDATTQEATATFPDPDAAGAQRSLWFANAASVAARATLAEGLGWHLGLWRLGREDQALWTPAVARTGAGS